jgi:hypothetical protein
MNISFNSSNKRNLTKVKFPKICDMDSLSKLTIERFRWNKSRIIYWKLQELWWNLNWEWESIDPLNNLANLYYIDKLSISTIWEAYKDKWLDYKTHNALAKVLSKTLWWNLRDEKTRQNTIRSRTQLKNIEDFTSKQIINILNK